MATGTLTPWPRYTILNASGAPISGALLNTYIAGTSTPQATYSDVTLLIPNANPIVADSAGRIGPVFLPPGTSYKFVFTNPDASLLYSQDNIASGAGAANSDIIGVAGETLTAGNAVYLSDGSGGKTAGLWYKADSANIYSSTSPEVGMVPANITISTSGTIRLVGSVTGLSSLTVGALYYIGTAGAITTTAPSNRRIIGQADTTSSLVVGPIPPVGTVDNSICDGRLTLTTGVPVTTADVATSTSVFFTPYRGNRIALYDGANWNIRTFTELTQALGTLTSGLPYDVFAFDNAGVVATEILAWTNATTRATALTTQDGVLSKTGALTRRYLGTFYTVSTTQTADTFAKRNLWNYYNRVPRPMRVLETTDTWAYDGVFRQARATVTNQLEFVVGVAEVPVEGSVIGNVSGNGSATNFWVAIGEDSTTTPDAGCLVGAGYTINVAAPTSPVQAQLKKFPAAGRHLWVWLEKGGAATTTWYGDNGADGTQSGIHGVLLG